MNYKLAKELKDAGFPLRKVSEAKADMVFFNKEYYLSPFLSELIEACGDEFVSLERFITSASREGREMPIPIFFCIPYHIEKYLKHSGDTPEEAVARLWLALNKKV